MVLQTMMMNTNKNNPLKKVGIFFEKVLVELKKKEYLCQTNEKHINSHKQIKNN